MNAAALTRRGGNVLVVGDPAHPTIQALVRWDPAGFAERELEERRSAHLPPASRLATLTGPTGAVDDAVTVLTLPDGAELDRQSTRLNSSHKCASRMPSSA